MPREREACADPTPGCAGLAPYGEESPFALPLLYPQAALSRKHAVEVVAVTENAYPLSWPEGWPRTQAGKRQRARFDTTFAVARDALFEEVRRLGGRWPVLSSDIPLRRDGRPYASARPPTDPGAAIYFEFDGQQVVFACDRWDRVRDNIQAIRKTVEALRGIERWGASDMLRRAFSAFRALPFAAGEMDDWRDVLAAHDCATFAEVEQCFRRQAARHHPDKGGNVEAFRALVRARAQAREAFGIGI